eukprot:scaffold131497_cov63-Phaeocystis_antarctica.AAC.1
MSNIWLASAKRVFFTESGPRPSVSLETTPYTPPVPYWMEKSVPSSVYVLEAELLYPAPVPRVATAAAADGTQRLALPVSKIALNFCGGVPISRTPKYWQSK